MEDKISIIAKIIIAGLSILFIWGIFSNWQKNREAKIIAAAEQICKERSLNIDCLEFGYEVLNEYEDFNTSDSRDYSE